jgi:hypothetical protein
MDNGKLNTSAEQNLLYSSNLVGGDQGEMVRRKIKDCSSHLGRLAREIPEIHIKQIQPPSQGKLDVHLGHSSSMESNTGSHAN